MAATAGTAAMFNVLLDRLPEEFEGVPINTDYRIGIQITQAMQDLELTDEERSFVVCDLLFGSDDPDFKWPDADIMSRGIVWFLTGWHTDNYDKAKKSKAPVTDMDVDQWRIYSAFRAQYGIDLNTAHMHYWIFMGLLTTLNECAFTRVVDVRTKKLTGKMSKELKDAYLEQKAIYALEAKETPAEKREREAAQAEFLSKVKINRHKEQ